MREEIMADMLDWMSRLSQDQDPVLSLVHILRALGLDRPGIEAIASRLVEITRTIPPSALFQKRYAAVMGYLIWAYCGPLAHQIAVDLYGEDWAKSLPLYDPPATEGLWYSAY